MAVQFDVGYLASGTWPMTHARLLWARLDGAITATSATEGYPATNAAAIDTASWWWPTGADADRRWRITYAAPQVVDAVGIAAHDLAGVTVTIEVADSGAFRPVATITPADNGALLVLFAPVTTNAMRISIGARRRIGVIYTGRALAMVRPAFAAAGLLDLGREAVLTSYVSEGGQLLARFLQRRGLRRDVSWAHLPEPWYRQWFDPFARAARTEPFFLAARPEGYPQDCVYGWVDQPIVPERMGVRDLLSVGFTVVGHAHD